MEGTHILIDVLNIPDPDRLKRPAVGEILLNNICTMTKMKILNRTSRSFGSDCGFSSLYLLGESHVSAHSYPEHHSINLDVFTCKTLPPFVIKSVIEVIMIYFNVNRNDIIYKVIPRVICRIPKLKLEDLSSEKEN